MSDYLGELVNDDLLVNERTVNRATWTWFGNESWLSFGTDRK